jgi:hypothetical protein
MRVSFFYLIAQDTAESIVKVFLFSCGAPLAQESCKNLFDDERQIGFSAHHISQLEL